jgi:hypothetical protein
VKLQKLVLSLLLIVVAITPSFCRAQAVGNISGNVADSTGAVIPGAQVKVQNQGTSEVRQVQTDSGGHFSIPLLPIGVYTVTVVNPGFKNVTVKDATLEVQQSMLLDIKMSLESVSSEISVTGENQPVQLQTSDATLGQVIHADQVGELPLNGRNFVQLALLSPGATRGEQPGDFMNQGNSSEVSFRGSVSLSVQGMRENANDWRLDGVDNNELTAGGVGFLPQVDAIQEFSVLTFNYSAQYGSRAGSTVLVSTKSGTNRFHGSVFEFLRNDALDARNYFDPPKKGKYIQNEFGFSLGGPIIPNETFFFGDYQGNRVRQGIPVLSIVPTQNQQNGIFTGTAIFDPSSTHVVNPATGQLARNEFVNDTITNPSPIGKAILALYPLPNGSYAGGFNYLANPVKTLNDDQFDVRLDHQMGAKDHFFARFSRDNASQFVPSGLPGFGSANAYASTQTFQTHARNIAISNTHVFSSSIVNQITAGYNRVFNYITSFGDGSNEASKLGIPGANLGSYPSSGMTLISVAGINPLGDRGYSPFQGGTNVFHYFDNLNILRGAHAFDFGFDFRAMQENTLGDFFFAGSFSFDPNFTGQFCGASTSSDCSGTNTLTEGNAIASLLLGLPASGQRSDELNGYIRGRRWKEYRGYAEDKWTISPKLTLNLGLAYGVTTPLSEAANRFANFDFHTGKLYVAGQNSDSHVGVAYDYSNIEPRFGFSYSPFPSRKTIFRGGFGLFHDVSAQSGAGGLQQNPPFVNEYGFTSDNVTPVRTLATGFPDNSQIQPFATYTGNLTAQDTDFKQGLIQQYNFNIQQQLPASTIVTVAYAASHGTRLLDKGINLNTAPPGPGFNDASRRPYPQYNTISGFTAHGWVGYRSLQIKAERRAANGLYLLASYTYSKTLTNGMVSDTVGDPGVPYYPLVPFKNADKGLGATDLRNNFSLSFLYAFPFGAGQKFGGHLNRAEDAVLGGWQSNAIISAHSGFPLGMQEIVNNSGTGITSRPDQVCNPNLGDKASVTEWFNTACYQSPAPGLLGNAPRTYGYGPGQTNVDFSLFKTFRLFKEHSLEFRSEFFNIFNHTQFATPDQFHGDSTYGAISSTVNNNRQIQFALKYLF